MFDARAIPEFNDPEIVLNVSRKYHNKTFEIEVCQSGVSVKNMPLAAFEELLYINFIKHIPKSIIFILIKVFKSNILQRLFEKSFFDTVTDLKTNTGDALWTGTMR